MLVGAVVVPLTFALLGCARIVVPLVTVVVLLTAAPEAVFPVAAVAAAVDALILVRNAYMFGFVAAAAANNGFNVAAAAVAVAELELFGSVGAGAVFAVFAVVVGTVGTALVEPESVVLIFTAVAVGGITVLVVGCTIFASDGGGVIVFIAVG